MKHTTNLGNDQKKILVIGANGFLGKNLLQFSNKVPTSKQTFSFLAADLEKSHIPSENQYYYINITNRKDTIKKILHLSPDIILLTAALTDVDYCEEHKKLATKINIEGPKNVINACKELGSKLIFLSTDFVFDGTKKVGTYSEEEIPNPQSHYAKTKYQAELTIMNSDIDYLICRTAVLYGWNPDKLNFITWVLDKLRKKEKISILTTQINNATFVRNLAHILIKLLEIDAKGIYHTAGDGALSRYQMATKCAEIFSYNKNLITPIDFLQQKAKRPNNAGLDISKVKQLLGAELQIYSLEDGLKYMKNHRIEQYNS